MVAAPTDALPRGRRLQFLDALRGLAAVYVLVYHLAMLPQPHLELPRWAALVASAGGTGVTLFFIVSAFSLYYTMPLRLKEADPSLNFYVHRFFRIAPLFYFMIAVSMVRDVLVFGVWHSPLEIALSLGFVFNLVPTMQEGFVWAGWTIGVEMLFYAVFPLIYFRVRDTGRSIALCFVLLLAWMVAKLALEYMVMPGAWRQSILQWSTLRHFPLFAVGIVVYHLYVAAEARTVDGPARRGVGDALAWGGLFGFAALLNGWLPSIFGDNYYWQGVVFGCLFMGLALSPWRLVVNATTAWLGKISYSVYLLHTTAIYLMIPVYRWLYATLPSLTLAFLAALALTLAVVLPLSALTYRLVEKPGIVLGKRLMARWAARTARMAAGGAPTHGRP